ncbi:transcriptional regulator, winged helix family [Kribbella flavida DSM 17836]|uniref:Transcriptional regulator, winged helix family n=2 Tax=Kribbella flavida TaxID=182640 RepID=D2PSE9_KRIFD|nr:transcriptional regulator, winged helix family [Kribbella flavida DSM 17836]
MRFGVLGPLTVWTPDGDPVVVPEARVRVLLARLLVAPGRVVSADRLVDDLWGDALPSNPANALQTAVSRLRRAIGTDLVVRRPPGYLLNVPLDAVDSGRFAELGSRARRRTAAERQAALLDEALGLWRGDAYAGFADEPFARAAAAALEEQRLVVWEDYAEARLRLGDHAALAGELRHLVEQHPLRERLRAAQLRALHGAGRTTEALDGYRELSRLLRDELGLDPGAELAALHQDILRGEPSAPSRQQLSLVPPPAPLPASPTALVGRDGAVAEVRTLIGTHRMVTLTGLGGVGKTRLALEVARSQDEVCFVELAGLPRDATLDGVADLVAAALGIRDGAHHSRPYAERLAGALRGRQLLLVLDNCEHIAEPVAALVPQVLSAPGVRVLATSREAIGVSGEHLWEVPPLDIPSPGAPPTDVLRSGAVQLFAARAAAASPGFSVSADNAGTVAMICRRVDGIPLAIELASARIRVLGTAGLAERLDDRFAVLTGGPRDAPPRQRTLRAVLDWSWELLTAAEQTVLRRLAIFADGCSLDAAETLCSGDGVHPSQVLDLLARLVDRSLVVVTHTADGPRYRLLESVAAYGEQQLASEERDRLQYEHATYYTSFAAEAAGHLCGPDQQRWLRRLDTETGNLRRALTDDRFRPQLARALVWYWFLRGRLSEALRATVPEDNAVLAAWHAGFRLLSGERTEGHAAAHLHDAVTDPHERAMAGWFLGYATTRYDDPAVGEALIRAALAEFESLGDRWGIAAALSVRALQRYVRGELDSAATDAERSLAVFGETGDRWGRIQAGAVLGRLAEIAGDYPAATVWHREGAELAEELALWPEVSLRWSELGRMALLQGDHTRADELHQRGRTLAVEHSDPAGQEFAEVGLALSARRRGRFAEAEALLRPWLEWNRRFEADNGAALILAELGFAAEQRQEADTALDLHTEGLAAARRTGDPRAIALALEGLAGACLIAAQPDRAEDLLDAATRMRESTGAPLPPAERRDVDRIRAGILLQSQPTDHRL